MVKNSPANAGDIRDEGSNLGLGRSPRGGHGTPLQYSRLENPMHRRAWWATVYGVEKSQTRLSDLACTHAWLLLVISLVNSCDRDCMACKA